MAEINTVSAIDMIHSKLKKSDQGYFYVRNGKQHYRDRNEDYKLKQAKGGGRGLGDGHKKRDGARCTCSASGR